MYKPNTLNTEYMAPSVHLFKCTEKWRISDVADVRTGQEFAEISTFGPIGLMVVVEHGVLRFVSYLMNYKFYDNVHFSYTDLDFLLICIICKPCFCKLALGFLVSSYVIECVPQ